MNKSIIPATDFDKWQDGELTDQHFLEASSRRLANLQDSLEPLQETEKVIKNQISLVVERLGGKANVPGFASFVITEPGQTVSYDSQKLDRLVAALISEGETALAQNITACRKVGSRVGYLRITKARAADSPNVKDEQLLDL
jgi:hypothetical protein